MQRRFHSALDSLFIAPAALPMLEVISASMDPSAEMIEPRYVNEGTNSTHTQAGTHACTLEKCRVPLHYIIFNKI